MNIELLKKTAKESIGIILSDAQLLAFNQYANLLIEWNEKFNLTSITKDGEVLDKHFLDSLSVLKTFDFANKSVVDVGTGAGFPGLVIAIAVPTCQVTLVESNGKKINFLNQAVVELKLNNVKVVQARAEDYKTGREQFDVALARAVSQLNILLELIVPLLKVGGVFIAFKGPDCEDEIKQSSHALKVLGSEIDLIANYSLPISGDGRSLIFVVKNEPTKNKYPRQYNQIDKSPL